MEEEDGVGSNGTFNGVFIRAPAILSTGKNVEVLNTVDIVKEDDTHDKVIVAVKQNNLLATSFHPELTDDSRWHQYFVEDIVKKVIKSERKPYLVFTKVLNCVILK